MLLTDRLKKIAADAKAVRESLTMIPLDGDTTLQQQGERLIASSRNREAGVASLAGIFSEVYAGKRPSYHLQEAMSTSDFPLLFGDLLYRQLMGNYVPWPVTYPNYFRILELPDFRSLNMYTIDGGQGRLEKVGQYAPYPETTFVEGRKQISVAKYGRRYGISFEMVINDDLNAFRSRPQVMATGARRSEEYLATQQLCDSNGPHASFFTGGNGNIITDNPVLGLDGLEAAFTQLKSSAVDSDGEPILIDLVELVVGPALEATARKLLGATELHTTVGSTEIVTGNWMNNKVRLSVNPYIPYVCSNLQTDPWFLIASPSDPINRPAFMFGFLRGRRNPALYVKDPNQMSLGGGETGVLEGDFDTDSIDYKLRHIFGAAQGEPKMAVASDGSES